MVLKLQGLKWLQWNTIEWESYGIIISSGGNNHSSVAYSITFLQDDVEFKYTTGEKINLLVSHKLGEAGPTPVFRSVPQFNLPLQVGKILYRESPDKLQKLLDISATALDGVSKLISLQSGDDVPLFGP